jgi:hypothetical protein
MFQQIKGQNSTTEKVWNRTWPTFNQVTDTVDKFQKISLIVKGILCYRAETKGLMK